MKEAFSCFSDGCLNDDEETMIELLVIANLTGLTDGTSSKVEEKLIYYLPDGISVDMVEIDLDHPVKLQRSVLNSW